MVWGGPERKNHLLGRRRRFTTGKKFGENVQGGGRKNLTLRGGGKNIL